MVVDGPIGPVQGVRSSSTTVIGQPRGHRYPRSGKEYSFGRVMAWRRLFALVRLGSIQESGQRLSRASRCIGISRDNGRRW